jgi:hypothetical protein
MTRKLILSSEARSQIIEDALEILSKGWTRSFWATDAEGEPCSWDSKLAKRFNATGALMKALREHIQKVNGPYKIDEFSYEQFWNLSNYFYAMHGKNLGQINDDVGYEGVVTALKELKEYFEA